MNSLLEPRAIGRPLERVDGVAKVTGTAPYAFEQPVADPLYVCPLQAAIARGRIAGVDTAAAEALAGVVAVITHKNAPRLGSDKDKEAWILQSDEIHFRGQLIGAVVAESPEIARQAADLVRVEYAEQPHDVELRADGQDLYAPAHVNPSYPTDTEEGDVEAALAAAAVTIDQTYTTPMEHHNPMEPHTTVAIWEDGRFTLYDSTQGAHGVRTEFAQVFGLDPQQVRVVSPYVGGGFGSKGRMHPPVVLAGLAARSVAGRHVKLALTRQQMFSLAGYRTPTIQRVRLGADRQGQLSAIVHEVVEQTSKIKEFAEQTAVATRIMYASPHRRTTHRLAALDVPVPTFMRAPGEAPGMFAAEVALDELAVACGLDPVDLRIRNEPDIDPESGKPWSGRDLVGCLREGARRFGWGRRELGSGGAPARWLAGRHRRGELDLPARRASRVAGDDRLWRGSALLGADRCRRYRHRHLDGARSDRRRCARLPDRGDPARDRRHRAADGQRRGWIERDQLLGVGNRRRRRRVSRPAWHRTHGRR